jgi:indole-3-glycerol phosphate synthase
MSDKLLDICDHKRRHVLAAKKMASYEVLVALGKAQSPPRGFATALDRAAAQGYGLIGEIKKASPSAGEIRPDFNVTELAHAYRQGGAACLSVLTDVPFFHGDDSYIAIARAAVDLPVLRKDFMIDPWQIVESRALGADCVLLILAALSDEQAQELEQTAIECGLDVLIEVHDLDELERALDLQSPLIGVNNRDLKTMTTDLAVTESLAAGLPPDRVLVAESGIKSAADLRRLSAVGARRFLVGESLLRQADVAAATRALLIGGA